MSLKSRKRRSRGQKKGPKGRESGRNQETLNKHKGRAFGKRMELKGAKIEYVFEEPKKAKASTKEGPKKKRKRTESGDRDVSDAGGLQNEGFTGISTISHV